MAKSSSIVVRCDEQLKRELKALRIPISFVCRKSLIEAIKMRNQLTFEDDYYLFDKRQVVKSWNKMQELLNRVMTREIKNEIRQYNGQKVAVLRRVLLPRTPTKELHSVAQFLAGEKYAEEIINEWLECSE